MIDALVYGPFLQYIGNDLPDALAGHALLARDPVIGPALARPRKSAAAAKPGTARSFATASAWEAVSETVSASLCTADWGRWSSKEQDSDDLENQKENLQKFVNGPKFRACVCAAVVGGAPFVCA
jgi:hypothetical protein